MDEADWLRQREQMLRSADRRWSEVASQRAEAIELLDAYARELPWGAPRRQLRRVVKRLGQFAPGAYREMARRISPDWLPLLMVASRSDAAPATALRELTSDDWGPWIEGRRVFHLILYPALLLLATVLLGTFVQTLATINASTLAIMIGSQFADRIEDRPIIDNLFHPRTVGILIGCLLVAGIGWYFLRRQLRTALLRRVPLVGRAVRNWSWSRFAADLRRLEAIGVESLESFRLAGFSAASRRTQLSALQLAAQLESPHEEGAQEPLDDFPDLLKHAVTQQESALAIERTIPATVASIYRHRSERTMRWVSYLIFPLGIVLAGFVLLLLLWSILSAFLLFRI